MNRVFVKLFLSGICLFVVCNAAQAQFSPKIVAECTITYSVSIDNSNNSQTIKKLYIKGRKTRSEISNASFLQATLFDNKEGNAVVMKEVGGDKYISFFNADEWKEKNNFWDSSILTITSETRKILTYTCRKALIQTKNGNSYSFYYTTDLTASATENPYQFKKITGIVLEYESESKDGKSIGIKQQTSALFRFRLQSLRYRLRATTLLSKIAYCCGLTGALNLGTFAVYL